MNLNEKFMSEWRDDAEMSDDLFNDARKIFIFYFFGDYFTGLFQV